MPCKVCKDCGVEKSLPEFHKNKSMRDGHVNTCKECQKEYESKNRPRARANWLRRYQTEDEFAEKHKERQRQRHKLLRDDPAYRSKRTTIKLNRLGKKQQAVLDYLLNNPCLDCGEPDPIVLEFDHLRDKIMSVGQMLASDYSLETIFAEIAKCEVVCCNCHQRRTATRAGYWKLRV